MPRSVQAPLPPMEVQRADTPGPPASTDGYAGLPRSNALTMIVKDALLRHYGSFKAAAYEMGQMDQAQLTRDLDSGKFKFERLELCDLDARASVCRALYTAFGNADPQARRDRLIRNVRRALDELAEDVA